MTPTLKKIALISMILTGCHGATESQLSLLGDQQQTKDINAKLAKVSPEVRAVGCTTKSFVTGYFNAENMFKVKKRNKIFNHEVESLRNFVQFFAMLNRNDPEKCESVGDDRLEQTSVMLGIVDFDGDQNTMIISGHMGWHQTNEADEHQWKLLGTHCWKPGGDKALTEVACKDVKAGLVGLVQDSSHEKVEAFIASIKGAKLFGEIHSRDLQDLMAKARPQLASYYELKGFDRSLYVMQGHGLPIAQPETITYHKVGETHDYGPSLSHITSQRTPHKTDQIKEISPVTNRRVMFPDGFPKMEESEPIMAGTYTKCELQETVCPFFRLNYLAKCVDPGLLFDDQVQACFAMDLGKIASEKALRSTLDLSNSACLDAIKNKHLMLDDPYCVHRVNFYREKCTAKKSNKCDAYTPVKGAL